MRLFDAILEANHRAAAGNSPAALDLTPFAESLPVAALTCIDTRLNHLLPGALGLPEEQFVWLRNAGNIVTGPLSSTLRSISLACALKGAREIAILAHTDCRAGQATMSGLIDAFKALGVERTQLPANLVEFFGLFASERQNAIGAADFVRHSPLIGPRIPVHALLLDVATGRLEWIVNGYQTIETIAGRLATAVQTALPPPGMLGAFEIGEMPFPSGQIGEFALPTVPEAAAATPSTPAPPPTPAASPPQTPDALATSSASWQWSGQTPPWKRAAPASTHPATAVPPRLPTPSAPPKLDKPAPPRHRLS